jgi:hypothetical protein
MIITPSHTVAMDLNANYINYAGNNPSILSNVDAYGHGFQGLGYAFMGCNYNNALLFSNGEFTYSESISMFVKFDSLSVSDCGVLIGMSTTNYGVTCGSCSGVYVPRIYVARNMIHAGVYDGGRRTISTPIVAGQWYHIFTNGGPNTTFDLYVNGELVNARNYVSNTYNMNVNTVGIGCGNSWANFICTNKYNSITCNIDNIQAFDRALGPDEIKRLSNGLHALK